MPRRLLLALPYVISLAYAAIVLAVQPSDRLGAPDGWPLLDQCLYDDHDVAAMAQRGLNAHLGRKAGLVAQPPDLGSDALDHPPPLSERYFLEYPHAAVSLFRLPFDFAPPENPPVMILDGGIGDAHWHVPRKAERTFWTHLRWAVRCYEVAMLLVLWMLIATLQMGLTRDGSLASTGLLLCLPSALYFGINRFDALPTLLLALSLATLGRGWLVLSGGLLAVGAALKIAPGLLAPLILCYLVQTQGWRAAARWLLGALAVGGTILALQLATEDLTALLGPFRFQGAREPYGWTIYGFLLPPSLAQQDWPGKVLRHGGLLVLIVALCWKAIPSLEVLLRRGAVLLIGFVLLQVIFSPQWILWFYPLILPQVGRQRLLGILLATLDVSTYVLWPLGSNLEFPNWAGVLLQDVRLASQLGLCWFLLRPLTRTTT
jgi:hypothetical protein